MINVIDKKDCVGCNACVQRCPKQCISMHEDEHGFLYPKVDLNLCIHCDLCEKVCPVINQAEPREPLGTYAAKNPDDKVRMASSSGGIFFALAKKIIEEGGVVFGAKFNEKWEVVHAYADTIEGIRAFQGSKYVQSRIGGTFRQAEEFLKNGRKVMFTGTPCQIAALGLFLRKDYGDQLFKVDVVCHGVPSPMVWKDYLSYITRPKGASDGKNTVFSSLNELPVITGISFRDKRLGWEKFGFSVRTAASYASGKNSVFPPVNIKKTSARIFQLHNENPYFWAFNTDYTLRPSCFACPAKSGKGGSSVSIGDFWHVETVFPDIKKQWGVSLIMIHDEKLLEFARNNLSLKSTDYSHAVQCVKSIVKSEKEPLKYNQFWEYYNKNGVKTLTTFFRKYRFSKKQKYIINPIKKLLGENLLKIIKKYLRK